MKLKMMSLVRTSSRKCTLLGFPVFCAVAQKSELYGTRKDSRNQPYFATACWEPGMAPPPLSHSTPVTSSSTPDIFAIPYFVSNETTEVSQLVSYFTDTNFSGC